MADAFRLLIWVDAGFHTEGRPPAWLRSIVDAFSPLTDVELTLVSHGGDHERIADAFAGLNNVRVRDVSTMGSGPSAGDELDDAKAASILGELDNGDGFDALVVRDYGMAVRFAGIDSIRERLVAFGADLLELPGSARVREGIVSIVSASAALLCDTDDARSRIEHLVPECRYLTVCWPCAPTADHARRLVRRLKPISPPVLRGRKLRVFITGGNFHFIDEIVRRLSRFDEFQLKTSRNAYFHLAAKFRTAVSSWADVIVCEWCEGDAVYYSHNKRRGQRLIVRLHRYELKSKAGFLRHMQAAAVDQLITVGPYYQELVRQKVTDLPANRVVKIPNCVDASVFDREKIDGSRFNLGFIQGNTSRKRLDLALDILKEVRRHDPRFCLFAKGARLSMGGLDSYDQRNHFRKCFFRVCTDKLLQNAVVFDGYGRDIPQWFRRIGILLSTSNLESFHVAVVEAMMSGAPVVILPWEGAERLYGEQWIVADVHAAAQRILEMAAPEVWEERSSAARSSVERYDLDNVIEAWARILVEDRDPDEWV